MKAVLIRALLAATLSLSFGSVVRAGDPPSDVKSTIKEDAKTTGHAVSHSAKTVGHAVADKSKTAGHAIAESSKKIASDVKEGTHKAWAAVSGSKSPD